MTCRRRAPIARSSAISRERWVTVIVNVFQMMNEPTNSAMPAKVPKTSPTILKFSLIASAFSLATPAPVMASVPSGITAESRWASSVCETPGDGADVDRVELAGLAEHLLRGPAVEVRRRGAAEVLDPVAVANRAHDGELTGRALEQHLDRGAQRDAVVLGAGGVDGDLVVTGGRAAGEQLDIAAELRVGRHAVAVGRSATVGGDGPPVVVGEQRVAAHGALGRADAVDVADLVEHGRGDGAPGRADTFGRGVGRLGPDHRVGARRDLAEELVEGDPHRVGQDERPGQEGDAEGDGRRGQQEPQLVRHHGAQGRGQHGQAPRCFM